MRIFTLVAAFGLGAVCCLPLGCGANTFEHEFKQKLQQKEAVDLVIENARGDITIEGADESSTLIITALVKATTDERAKACILERNTKDGRLKIAVRWPDGGLLDGESCDLKVIVPVGGSTQINANEGKIKVTRLEGALRISSEAARIGIFNHEGDVEIDAKGEDVACHEIQGKVTVRNSDGWVKIIGVQENVKIETTNERIEIECYPTFSGVIDVKGTNSSIQATIGRKQTGEFQLINPQGQLEWDLGERGTLLRKNKTSATIVVKNRKKKSRIQTTNGNIKLIVP